MLRRGNPQDISCDLSAAFRREVLGWKDHAVSQDPGTFSKMSQGSNKFTDSVPSGGLGDTLLDGPRKLSCVGVQIQRAWFATADAVNDLDNFGNPQACSKSTMHKRS